MGVFAAILATVFVMLGQWQLRRLDERRETNAMHDAAASKTASVAVVGHYL